MDVLEAFLCYPIVSLILNIYCFFDSKHKLNLVHKRAGVDLNIIPLHSKYSEA